MGECKFDSEEYQELEKKFWEKKIAYLKNREFNIVNRLGNRLNKRSRKNKHPKWERISKN